MKPETEVTLNITKQEVHGGVLVPDDAACEDQSDVGAMPNEQIAASVITV